MKIAVLMSTYNGEEYIRQQIDSILAQQCACEFELLVRDDGSVDGTKQILEEYREQGKLKWYCGKNLGPAKSFLDLVRRSPGYDYYAFSDQDDYWNPDKLEMAVSTLRGESENCVYFANAQLVDENLKSFGRTVYEKQPRTDFTTVSCAGGILGCTVVFDKCVSKLIQEKPLPDRVCMHDYFVSELCLATGGKLVYDNRVCMRYRQHRANVLGVPHSFAGRIKNRTRLVLRSEKVSVAEQANELLNLYGEMIPLENQQWLQKLAAYNRNFLSRAQMALSNRYHCASANMGLSIRLAFLLGNR